MAALTTPISEEWIRDRVGLTHENLEDVKSLALPGTYHEKITTLGTALKKFTRLKNLDLSRNSLDSLKGLENCTLLENVNLYYNNLNTLDDLSPLKENSHITNLDLRLNPVARTEADYRLFVVNVLPNLKILDDRPVRESERDAAASHFASSTKQENKPPFELESAAAAKSAGSKARIVPSAIGATTMDADDCAVLNMLARSEAPAPQNTASAKTEPGSEDYKLSELKALGQEELDRLERRSEKSSSEHEAFDDKASYYQSKYPNIPTHRLSEIGPDDIAKQEADAYSAYKGQGHFTANPEMSESGDKPKSRYSSGASSTSVPGATPALIKLLDLVDKYWNGSKSLHDNKKFMKMALDLQTQMTADSTSELASQIERMREERSDLMKSAKTNDGLKRVKIKLDETETEMDKLRGKIRELQEENNRLRLSLHSHSSPTSASAAPAAAGRFNSHEVEELKHENYQLQFKLKQYSQMSELAKMLQESHKSLVQTNDHLLREIEELRIGKHPPKLNGH